MAALEFELMPLWFQNLYCNRGGITQKDCPALHDSTWGSWPYICFDSPHIFNLHQRLGGIKNEVKDFLNFPFS